MGKRGKVVVDLGNGSATITNENGDWQGTWSGVTRRGTADAIASDGWRLTSKMQISPADNGSVADVAKG